MAFGLRAIIIIFAHVPSAVCLVVAAVVTVVAVVVVFLFCLTTLYALNTPKIINENKQRQRWRQGQVYEANCSRNGKRGKRMQAETAGQQQGR